jgi:hypothetical protein
MASPAGRGASQLLIVPDTNHLEILDRDVLAPAMLAYLDRDQAATPPFSVRS